MRKIKTPRYPSLYQLNTRVTLTERSRVLGRRATLDDLPDSEWDRLAGLGFDWIWCLSVWQTGPAAQAISRTHPDWRRDFEATLPDLTEEDIQGSGFAIQDYTAHASLGGPAALARLRQRLNTRGLKLMLDFVPNHMAPDHRWLEEHPEYFVTGSEADLANAPRNFRRVQTRQGPRVLAHGKDPYFDGWPDTLQLNYSHPGLQEAMIGELLKIAGQCDGVRCDMAMLILPEVFERTWGLRPEPFWPKAIDVIKREYPDFQFLAEVYWDLEWTMQQQGFDYTYDKRLYDRLREGPARPLREHLHAALEYQDKLARFLENHDEPRAAATFGSQAHQAAATLTYLVPGLRFFHQGQLQGYKTRISPHLVRGPREIPDPQLEAFYQRLLAVLRRPVVRDGTWQAVDPSPAWEGNGSSEAFVASSWQTPGGARLLGVVNHAPHRSQCYLVPPFQAFDDGPWQFEDLLGHEVYVRRGEDLRANGLYLDLSAWQAQAFWITRLNG